MKKIFTYLLCLGFSANAFAQSTTYASYAEPLSLGLGGINAQNIGQSFDSNLNTFSNVTYGGILATVIFKFEFAAVQTGKKVTIKIGSGSSLLSLGLIGITTVTAYNDDIPVGTGQSLTSLLSLGILTSNNQIGEISFTPTGDFNNIRFTTNLILGLSETVSYYEAWTTPTTQPVSWVSVNAEKAINGATVSWKVNEKNVNYFNVEKFNKNSNAFESVQRVSSKGDGTNNYSFTDVNANADSYYRIAQTDFDGTTTYSKNISINAGASDIQIVAYPNPTSTNLSLNVPESLLNKTYRIIDINGKTHSSHKASSSNNIDVSKLSSGRYTILFETGKTVNFVKL